MTDYPKALAAAREAHTYVKHRGMTRAEAALGDLLAALDAARGEAVAWRAPNWAFGDEWQYADEPFSGPDGLPSPNNQPLYAAPPAAAVPPERDWTMIQSGDASIPAWVVHYANAIGAYMKAQNVQHWTVGPVQSRNEAKQPAALAVPDRDAVAKAIWLATKAYGSLDHARPSLSAEPRPLQKLIYEQADAAIIAMIAAAERAQGVGNEH